MEEVDKMSHRLRTCGAAAVLLLLLTLLSSCGQSAVQDETATDYNQYIPSHGVTAYTKDLYIFFDSGRLFYVGRSQPSQLFPLCFQADCDHKNSSCTAWLNTPSRSIYAAGDNLYYIDADKDAKALKEYWRENNEEIPGMKISTKAKIKRMVKKVLGKNAYKLVGILKK